MFSKRILTFFIVTLFTFSLSGLAHATSIVPQNFRFNTNIKLGTTLLPDVSYLQSFLNQNTLTRVAATGPGSDSELTNYFGTKTSDAVKRFQELYADEVLKPAGLTTGTGFFGEFTRKKINSLLSALGITATPESKKINVVQNSNTPKVSAVFSTQSFEQNSLTQNSPIISGLYPNLVKSDSENIHIYGYNFGSVGNVVYGSLGSIENVPSSNNTITIRLKDFSEFERAAQYYSGTTTQIYIKVANLGGVSQELASVQYTFPDIGTYPWLNVASTSNPNDKSESSNTNALGMVDAGSIDKEIHGFSPGGALIKLIGGEETFDTLYGYTPSGMIFGGGTSGAGGASGGGMGGGAGGMGGGGDIDNFGGQITNITYCTCSDGQLLDIEDVRGESKSLFFMYGYSKLYENYNIFSSGVNVIGGYDMSSMECEVYNGESCSTEGTATGIIDSIRGIGTSMM
jgi:hypothetical protein